MIQYDTDRKQVRLTKYEMELFDTFYNHEAFNTVIRNKLLRPAFHEKIKEIYRYAISLGYEVQYDLSDDKNLFATKGDKSIQLTYFKVKACYKILSTEEFDKLDRAE